MALSTAHSVTSPTGNNNVEIRNYILNEHKALQKKRIACNRPFIKVIPKDGGKQLKIECSVGCFEVLKSILIDTSLNKQIFDRYNLAIEVKQITDQNGIYPEYTLRAFNKLSSGAIGKKHKFTVNIYNTQSSLLVNGRNTSSFQNDILPDIM